MTCRACGQSTRSVTGICGLCAIQGRYALPIAHWKPHANKPPNSLLRIARRQLRERMEELHPKEPTLRSYTPKKVCNCGRDFLAVPLDEAHHDCPNPRMVA